MDMSFFFSSNFILKWKARKKVCLFRDMFSSLKIIFIPILNNSYKSCKIHIYVWMVISFLFLLAKTIIIKLNILQKLRIDVTNMAQWEAPESSSSYSCTKYTATMGKFPLRETQKLVEWLLLIGQLRKYIKMEMKGWDTLLP